LRLLHLIYAKHNLLPAQYNRLTRVERAFVRQSVLAELRERK